jgi:hypothetical protein
MYFGTKNYLKSNHYHTAKHIRQPSNSFKKEKRFQLIFLYKSNIKILLVSNITFL